MWREVGILRDLHCGLGLHRSRPRRNSLPDRDLAAERPPRTRARWPFGAQTTISAWRVTRRYARLQSRRWSATGKRWRRPQHLGYASSNSRARSRAGLSSSKGSRACLHLRLASEPCQHFDDCVFVARLPGASVCRAAASSSVPQPQRRPRCFGDPFSVTIVVILHIDVGRSIWATSSQIIPING
jgi:hypothetical protein